MIVRRGKDWGEMAQVPESAIAVKSDAEAAAIVTAARRSNAEVPPLELRGGDLARTLGVKPDSERSGSDDRTHLSVDLGATLVDGRLHWFVAHLVARRAWWRGRLVIVANAGFLGAWNIAPRAHPGDGLVDILDTNMPTATRFRARRRVRSGTHLPHPLVEQRRTSATQFDLDPALDIYADGIKIGRASRLSIRVEPEALDVWI